MTTVRQFLDEVGRENVLALGFKAQDVSRAVTTGLFPAGWYPFLRDLAAAQGRSCPDHIFRWSRVPSESADQMRGAA